MKYIATIQVVIEGRSSADASDVLREVLSDCEELAAWSYLKLGEHYLYPTEYTGPIPFPMDVE